MAEYNTQRMFFFGLLFFVTLAFFWLIRGFLQPIFWAVALGIIVYPAHARLVPLLKNRGSLAAGLSVLIVVIVVILPLIGLGAAVTNETHNLCTTLTSRAANTSADEPAAPAPAEDRNGTESGDEPRCEINLQVLENLYAWAQTKIPLVGDALARLNLTAERLESTLSSAAVTASEFIATNALAIGQNTIRITIYFALMLYLLFFFLRDGTRLLDGLVRALPLGDARERHLLDRFAQVARATIKGTLVVGVVQGAIGGIAFAVLGLPAPVLWGVLMALLSILPAIGPAVVWVPGAIYLFVQKEYIAGVALVLIGVLVIGLVDNLLRPVLVGRDTRMPDYLVLLSTLGGLAAFGLAGIVIGPIIAAFFLSVWEMAQAEFQHDEEAAHERELAAETGNLAAKTREADASGVEAPPTPAMLGRLREPPGADDDNA